MTSKIDFRTVIVNLFIMAVDKAKMYSNEAKRDNKDIYDDLKLEKSFGLQGLHKINLTLQGFKQ